MQQTSQRAQPAAYGGERFTLLVTGRYEPSERRQNAANWNTQGKRPVRLPISIYQSQEHSVRKTRIFIARMLLRLSMRLASLAVWIAPEIRGEH